MPLALAFCAYTAIRARWGEEFGGPTYGEEAESESFLKEHADLAREARRIIRKMKRHSVKPSPRGEG